MAVTTTQRPPRMDARLRARRRAVTTARRRRRRRFGLAAAGLVALALAGVVLVRSPLLEIDDIRVAGVGGDRAEQVRQQLRDALGTSLVLVDTGAQAGDVASLAWVADAAVHRRLPTTLEVEVTPREPVAVVRTVAGQWRVDAEQVVVAAGGGDHEGLMPIDGGNAVVPPPGHTLRDDTLRDAVRAVAGLPDDLAERVSAVDASRPRALALRLESGPTAWLGSADRLKAKLDALALVLADLDSRLSDGLAGIAEIDVRTPENPTVRRASAPDGAPGPDPG